MEKGNKMYSAEVIDKATSAVAMGFSCDDRSFKESIKSTGYGCCISVSGACCNSCSNEKGSF